MISVLRVARGRTAVLRRFYSDTPVESLPPLPKAERNPAHKSSLALPPRKPPAPIVSTSINTLEHDYDVAAVRNGGAAASGQAAATLVGQDRFGAAPVVVEARMTPPLPSPPQPAPELARPFQAVRRPVGGFRGGLIGFLLGLTTVGGYGYFELLDDYRSASSLMLASVEELKASTQTMTTHIKRIERVESDLNQVIKDAASKKDVESLRAEYKKLIDSAHLDYLDLKAHVWGVEQDLNALTKVKEVRI